jgi:hypothetical protein
MISGDALGKRVSVAFVIYKVVCAKLIIYFVPRPFASSAFGL